MHPIIAKFELQIPWGPLKRFKQKSRQLLTQLPRNSKDLVDTKLGEACQNIFSNGGSFHRNGARLAAETLGYTLELAITIEGVGIDSFYRFFTNTPMETSDPASIREMSEAANNFGSPAE